MREVDGQSGHMWWSRNMRRGVWLWSRNMRRGGMAVVKEHEEGVWLWSRNMRRGGYGCGQGT